MERTGHILSTDYSVSLLDSNLFEGYCGECGNNLISQLLNTDFKQRIQPNKIDSHNFFTSKVFSNVKCEHNFLTST